MANRKERPLLFNNIGASFKGISMISRCNMTEQEFLLQLAPLELYLYRTALAITGSREDARMRYRKRCFALLYPGIS